ncbi:ATP-binding cassette, subfamily C, CydC [Ectothiorhodosinus mongolicus]|uniref:ATP-binding cassette, subfamily C, CydC n=1 Tax=Ectothiorhodosinus mongolicus TaxID=233100 RepID=A0A1R3VMI4_9GAMM|nr:thiol reductant ABC exporter subunit CydC [Ectothiorhodosinus mongolicus]ULX56291.1 thiol reductant ABC exporter subunit CydC [Ectothiorhodosinus mongolicus]SIT65798.1 ATP-binding cassette, subfamily C, CydC [Ectothiorhodosinus mongolicus]
MNHIWPFVRQAAPRLPWFILGILLSVLAVLAAMGLLAAAGWIVAGAASISLLAVGSIELGRSTGLIRGFALTRTLARYAERLVNHEAVLRHLADLRHWLFMRLAPLDPATLARFRSADLLQRLVGDVDTLDGIFLRVITPTLTALFTLLVGAIVLGWLAPLTGLWIIILLAGTGIVLPLVALTMGKPAGEARTIAAAQVRELAIEGVKGLAELRVFGALEKHSQALQSAEANRARAEARLAAWGALGDSAVLLATLGALWLALWLGAAWVANDQLSAPLVVVIVLASLAIGEALLLLPGAFLRIGQINAAAGRLRQISDTTSSLPEAAQPALMPTGEALSIDKLSLSYPGREAVLRQVSFSLKRGRTLLVTGASGSGKSSLAQALLRLVPIDSGEMQIDTTPIEALRYEDLYTLVGVLSQETVLFADTVAGNLRLGKTDASEDELWEALRLAVLDEFIQQLPEGLETPIGEGGALLSGGQARRLALARMLLRQPQIAILDEPYRGLDAGTIDQLNQRLAPWLAQRCVLVIAHEPSMSPPASEHLQLLQGQLTGAAPHGG